MTDRPASCDTPGMLYQDPSHLPFQMHPDGGSSSAAALLIHGFLGTPAEMRPLGRTLRDSGIAVTGLALPGFGQDIDRLPRTRVDDWLGAATDAWLEVRRDKERSILVGFSMGGAIALCLAAAAPPDQLILIEPFRRIQDARARLLPLAKYVLPEIKPYEDADFSSPRTRDAFALSGQGVDLGDPQVQRWIRENATIPTPALIELQKAGDMGFKAAERISCPTLILQSDDEEVVTRREVRELADRLAGPVRVETVGSDHQLVRDDRPDWPHVRELVLEAVRQEASAR